jgi:predicted alpha/beta superfamily hydrolase
LQQQLRRATVRLLVRTRFPLLLLFLLASAAFAASPHKEVVNFTYTGGVDFGTSVFVVGNHPDVGNNDVTKAVKLRWTAGHVWTGDIAIEAGVQLQYRFISRSTTHLAWCNNANAVPLTGDLTRTVPAQPAAPYRTKTLYYLSGWSAANLYHNVNNTNTWAAVPMERIGDGRTAGESLYKISISSPGDVLEFVFNNGAGSWDNPPGGGADRNYRTTLDVIHVQDGNVYPYQPPHTVSPPQITTHFINSTAQNIPGRNIRVYVPRGYEQNTSKRYPVLYMHDGQNVFPPAGPFGTWNADSVATTEIGRGRMRETIIVGVNHGDSARIDEYRPPTDGGRADAYAHFLIHNVRPFIDTNYRTLTDAANTVTLGSSMGGLVSLYLGREYSTFGKIGVVSPAFWTAPIYVSSVEIGTKKPLRVYLDMGTNEGMNPASPWADALRMYDIHLKQQYAFNGDFWFVAGCGAGHNEAAWEARLPLMYRYLLPAREEPAILAQREHPPQVQHLTVEVAQRSAAVTFPTLYGFTYTLSRSANFSSWTPVTSMRENLPWSSATLPDADFPQGERMFWRIEATPAP